MAKFLTTTGISHELEELIKNAKERVILVSPYLKLVDKLRMHLEDKDRLKLEIRIIYGKADLQPDEVAKLEQLKELKISFLKNLHAKCYMSEDRAILASMNLYEFSQQHNEEMGILVTATDDPKLFSDIKDEVQRLIRTAQSVNISVQKLPPEVPPPVAASESPKSTPSERKKAVVRTPSPVEEAEFGHCIRCSDVIPYDTERPYCDKDYKAWAKWKNPVYEDKHCHGCGTEHKATMSKPLCRGCYHAKSRW